MTYRVETVAVLQGRSLAVPRHYVRSDLRTFRAGNRADAEYLATVLNSMTDEQHMTGLGAATAERMEA